MKKLVLMQLLLTAFALPAYAEFSIEARGDVERWNNGFDEKPDLGGWAGFGTQYFHERWFGGAGFGQSVREYEVQSFQNTSVKRTEFELVAGYALSERWALFSGYRLFRIDYDSADSRRAFVDNIHGIGAGIHYGTGLSPKVTGFINTQLGVVLGAVDYKQNSTIERGRGVSGGGEIGLARNITSALNLVGSVKYQGMAIQYGDLNWTNSYVRIGARLNYRF